ncbi:MAG: O-antigen ligase family protein [Gallionellaceae bacterium]|jgi:O-antigen ligase
MNSPLINNTWQLRFAVFAASLAGFAIPVSTALTNISIALLILAFFLTPALWKELPNVLRQPFIIACLILYAVLLIGSSYSSVGFSGAGKMLLKMREYLLVPLIFAVCLYLPVRRALLIWFAVGVLLSIVISTGLAIGGENALYLMKVLNQRSGQAILQAASGDWMAFRTHTYHNFFAMMLVVGLLALNLTKAIQGNWKKLSWFIIALGLFNILILVQGRSIQFILLLIFGLFFVLWKKRQGLIIALALIITVPPVLYFSSPNIQANIAKIQNDISEYQQGRIETSVGYRLGFYKNSLALIQENPILGHGTGSYPSEYRRLTGITEGNLASQNPHNDYFWLGVEQGILGVIALLGIIVATIYQARKRAPAEQWTAIVLAISVAIIALGNSFFTDSISRTAFILLACALLAGDSAPLGKKQQQEASV